MSDLLTDRLNMGEILGKIPTLLREIVGTLNVPFDNGLAISESIVAGECIGASDGSLIKEYRTARGHMVLR